MTAIEKAEEVVLQLYDQTEVEYPFPKLVEHTCKNSGVDEATAKAAILRLSSDGLIEFTPDWRVRKPVPDPVYNAA